MLDAAAAVSWPVAVARLRFEGVPEAGWVLARWAHGQGFGSEGLAAALAWLDHATEHRRSVCLIDPANVASIRVAEKAGFGGAQAVRFRDSQTLLLERVR